MQLDGQHWTEFLAYESRNQTTVAVFMGILGTECFDYYIADNVCTSIGSWFNCTANPNSWVYHLKQHFFYKI